jgi:hypothetical protein
MADPVQDTTDDKQGEAPGMELHQVEVGTLERLVDALGSLKDAQAATKCGFVSDFCENAAGEIRKAMRLAGA